MTGKNAMLAPEARGQSDDQRLRLLTTSASVVSGRRRGIVDFSVLAALGATLIGLTLWMARWSSLSARPRDYLVGLAAQLAVYSLAAAWVSWRQLRGRGVLILIAIVALAAQLAVVAAKPSASDDIYRYVWDGRIQAHGINPYRYPPDDPALAAYRDSAIYPYINRKGVPTIYPPVAQTLFLVLYALHPNSVIWTKTVLIGVTLLTGIVLSLLLRQLGLPAERVILFAWHPLLILEIGSSGHIEILVLGFLILALWARLADRPVLAGLLLACATLTKFYALVALPALLWPGDIRAWRRDIRFGCALVGGLLIAYLPFLSVGTGVFGYLVGYTREEGIASGERFYLLGRLGELATPLRLTPPRWLATLPVTDTQVYQAFLVGVMALLALWCWLYPIASGRAVAERILLLFLTLLTLATPSYPWYALLVLAFIPFARRNLLLPAFFLTGGAGFLYLQWWWPGQTRLPNDIVYGGSSVLLLSIALCAAAMALRVRPRLTDPTAPRPLRRGAFNRGGTPVAVPAMAAARSVSGTADEDQPSLFDRFPWCYAFCREWLFRDHTTRIAAALWPSGQPRAGSTLLELGCGPGFYSRRLATRYATLRVTGIDRSIEQLERAQARAIPCASANCRFECGDVRALAQPTGETDTIVVSRLFTILPEQIQALAEMHRVLRAGGHCFVAEPRSRFWTAIPLRALWLLAGLMQRRVAESGEYREPTSATVLTSEEFGTLLRSQPWAEVRQWHDRQYHYAVCRKAATRSVAEAEAIAAD